MILIAAFLDKHENICFDQLPSNTGYLKVDNEFQKYHNDDECSLHLHAHGTYNVNISAHCHHRTCSSNDIKWFSSKNSPMY